MPRRCSMYECNSNYDSQRERVTVYRFPKNELERKRWLRAIPINLENFNLDHLGVCIKHWKPGFPTVRRGRYESPAIPPDNWPGIPSSVVPAPENHQRQTKNSSLGRQHSFELNQLKKFNKQDIFTSSCSGKVDFTNKLLSHLQGHGTISRSSDNRCDKFIVLSKKRTGSIHDYSMTFELRDRGDDVLKLRFKGYCRLKCKTRTVRLMRMITRWSQLIEVIRYFTNTEASDHEYPKMQRQLPLNLAELLISAVQKREVLYNVNHKGYKNRQMIEMAWKDVAGEVGRDAKYCRTTWSKLRATYNRILSQAKLQPSTTPKWYLFHQMAFIKDYVVHGSGIGYVDTSSAVTLAEGPALPNMTIEWDEMSHGSSSVVSFDDTMSLSQREETDFSSEQEDYFQEGVSPAQALAGEEEEVKRLKKEIKIEPSYSYGTPQAFLDIFNGNKQPQQQHCRTAQEGGEDRDMNLCRGLIPFMKDLYPRNKRIFYQKALSLCNEILDSQDD